MGLFDFITGGGPEKQIQRQSKRVANRDAQPEDRDAAARWLAADGSPQALLGLMGRFDIAIENQMKDAGEKEQVFQLLLEHGQACLEPARKYVQRCKHIGHPLRLIEAVGGKAEVLAAIYEMLDVEATREDFKSERKRQLLVKLADYRDPGVIPSASRFLKDFDEGVRYVAAEACIAQESDEARLPLLMALANPEEESNRLRVRIAEVFHGRGWSLEDQAGAIAEKPPTGWTVASGALARA